VNQLEEREVALIDLYLQVLLAELENRTEACEEVEDQVGLASR
jgi:hypothetical protein